MPPCFSDKVDSGMETKPSVKGNLGEKTQVINAVLIWRMNQFLKNFPNQVTAQRRFTGVGNGFQENWSEGEGRMWVSWSGMGWGAESRGAVQGGTSGRPLLTTLSKRTNETTQQILREPEEWRMSWVKVKFSTISLFLKAISLRGCGTPT